MGFFKNLFKKEEKLDNVLCDDNNKIERTEIEDLSSPTCALCGLSIYGDQRIKTYVGKKFHLKPCWYKMNKDAHKKLGFS